MIIEDLLHLYGHYQRITLVAQHKQTKKYWFLFSVIELLTLDNDNYDSFSNLNWHTCGQHESIRSKSIKNGDYIFYIVKEKGVAGSVISSFLHPSSDNILKGEIVDILNPEFNLEPNGASPLVIRDNTYAKNALGTVLPKYKSGCMVWAQIDLNRVTQRQFLTDVYKKSLSELTLNTLGFDINIHSEHIGNMYLVAPNPYIRDIDTHLSLNPPGIYYKLFCRKNIYEELTIRITDRHQKNILVYEKDFRLNDNVGLIELPCEPHYIELKILNANKDVIFISGPDTFIRSMQINMSVGGKELVLENTDKNGKIDTTTIPKFEPTNPIHIGERKSDIIEEFFAKAQYDREYIAKEESLDFIFFPGQSNHETPESQKNSAKNVVREIINRANNTCYLCDPYFATRDIVDFAYHIQSMGVKIRILNCKEYVKIAEAKLLNATIKEYNSKFPGQPIECRLLKGKGVLHDRFIIADDNIWFLGSSFNEFGKRATCISKIPKSSGKEIIKKIESWYQDDNSSENIEQYSV